MNAKDEKDLLEQLQREFTTVVTVPAPGGTLSISMHKDLDEAKRLRNTQGLLHGMIESTEESILHRREGYDPSLLTLPSQLAKGVEDVSGRLEYETRHKETDDRLGRLEANAEAVAKKIDRNTKELARMRRKMDGENVKPHGGRPSCDHGDKQKLRVIHYAMSKRRDHASDYARHVFGNWKGAGGYGSADSLRKATQRFLTDNGLPTLPTTEAEHGRFVKAVNGNAVMMEKLEKQE